MPKWWPQKYMAQIPPAYKYCIYTYKHICGPIIMHKYLKI